MSAQSSINLNPVTIIHSLATGKFYLDEDRSAHLFFSEPAARDFARDIPDAVPGDYDFVALNNVMTEAFETGALRIVVHKEYGRIEKIDPTRKLLAKKHYNNRLCGTYHLLIQSHKKQYLDDLKRGKYIVPIRIRKADETGKTQITYGIVMLRGETTKEFKYLCFTSMEEYGKWADKNAGWEPILVDFDTLQQIGSRHGYIVNVAGVKFAFPVTFLSSKKQEESENA